MASIRYGGRLGLAYMVCFCLAVTNGLPAKDHFVYVVSDIAEGSVHYRKNIESVLRDGATLSVLNTILDTVKRIDKALNGPVFNERKVLSLIKALLPPVDDFSSAISTWYDQWPQILELFEGAMRTYKRYHEIDASLKDLDAMGPKRSELTREKVKLEFEFLRFAPIIDLYITFRFDLTAPILVHLIDDIERAFTFPTPLERPSWSLSNIPSTETKDASLSPGATNLQSSTTDEMGPRNAGTESYKWSTFGNVRERRNARNPSGAAAFSLGAIVTMTAATVTAAL
ncbi:hypothetical protein BBBOND_0100350 [Babesia bigemina]|uniref:Uncharacterized protein n=1 Tax=Babesia bigemina TaxID=5866 RepID=A0A061CYI0_BABBI|nr:hypothetical protein BBBOND_0100350 [Babesia bigemina]CDR93706.1 hypothetical protein BBBOND_0100350 [Babesia bigemina]|eukprot:XP_012765892.1 hypothetical protein BBBOND_0100350 [Babesia bigemina]